MTKVLVRKVIQKAGVQIPPSPALFVDAKALNNEASVHAYNPWGREKEVHNLTLDFTTQSVKLYTMKHSESGTRKVMKQLKKCPDIKEIRQLASGHMILATNGQQYLAHLSAKAFHPLRRWLKKNTRIQSLKF